MDGPAPERQPNLNNFFMMTLAIVVGSMAAIGAFTFRMLINLFHRLSFFYTDGNLFQNTTQHTPLLLYPLAIILIPMIGAYIVTFLITHFSPESKGHGVPETMYAIHYKHGKISPVVGLIKVVASAITIATGGSAGREGPIIQIGASIGSTLGQIISMPSQQRIILMAAGAGAGIAATFNAPLTGLAFAIELILVSVNANSISIVTIAVVSAICVSSIFFGAESEFTTVALSLEISSLQYYIILLSIIPLSFLTGLISVVFIKVMYIVELFFDNTFQNSYVRHVTGMGLVGIILYLLGNHFGHYYVDGVGYTTINDLFQFLINNPWLLIVICLCKILATCLTLGSGGSGGVFSPSLFIGATLGGAYGILLNHFIPGEGNLLIFVIAGMAGIVASATGLAITAIVLAFEITRDYTTLIPIMMTVTLSTAVSSKLTHVTIFTMNLARRGHFIPDTLERIFKK